MKLVKLSQFQNFFRADDNFLNIETKQQNSKTKISFDISQNGLRKWMHWLQKTKFDSI